MVPDSFRNVLAYKLALPSHSRIHDVFHCSLLKPHEGPPPSQINKLPFHSIDHHPIVNPLAVLQFQNRMLIGILVSVRFALIQWEGLAPDDTSWEKWDELYKVYDLNNKVDFDDDDIVMSKAKKGVHIDPITDVGPSYLCKG